MPNWVKAAIGLAVALVVLAIAREYFVYGPGSTVKWKNGEITVNPRPAPHPAPEIASASPSAPSVQAVECKQEWNADSGWRRGGSSPSQFCGGEKLKREARFRDRKVKLI